MTRRLLLQGLLLSFWSKAAAAACRLSGRFQATGDRVVRASSEPTSEFPTLSAPELQSLVAFGEVLVGGRALLPADRQHLAEHIEEGARESPDQLALYETTAKLLDRLAGKPFSRLEMSDRIQLLSRYRLDSRVLSPGEEDPDPFATEARIVRTRIIPDLIDGYWGSPAGWAAIGYQGFPGRCGDLTRYTRPEV